MEDHDNRVYRTDGITIFKNVVKHCGKNNSKIKSLTKRLLKLMEDMDDEDLYLFGGTWGINIVTMDDESSKDDCIVAIVGNHLKTSGGCGAVSHKSNLPHIFCLEGSETV